MQETFRNICPKSKAINDHKTNDAKELTFKMGDIILVLSETSKRKNWMEGCLDADRTKRGLVPVYFVTFMDEEQEHRILPKYTAINDHCPREIQDDDDDDDDDHRPNEASELAFKKGDLIIMLTGDIKERKGRVWADGCLNSDRTKRGLFPIDCVN